VGTPIKLNIDLICCSDGCCFGRQQPPGTEALPAFHTQRQRRFGTNNRYSIRDDNYKIGVEQRPRTVVRTTDTPQPALVLKSIGVQYSIMTHDTPNQDKTLRWCSRCQLNVEPIEEPDPTCPSCGRDLS